MQLNMALNKENIKELNNIIHEILELKVKLEDNTLTQLDIDNLESIIEKETKLFANIVDSCEDVSYMKPYLKKCGSTYNITIPPAMSIKMGLAEDSRDIVYVIDEESKLLLVKKVNKNKNTTNHKVYKASKSKVTSKGISYNLGIPKSILDRVISNPDIQMRVAVRKNVIEISNKKDLY